MTGYKWEVSQGYPGGLVLFTSGTIPADIAAAEVFSSSLKREDTEPPRSEASVFTWSQRLMKSPRWKAQIKSEVP